MNSIKNRIWRWIASLSIVLNILVNYWTNVRPFNGKTIGEISNSYNSLFTPANYAFSIWGCIYLSFIIYSIVQLLPSQRNKAIYNNISTLFIISSLLSIAWVVVFSFELIGLSVLIISAMLILSLLMLIKIKGWISINQRDILLSAPFALYSGWLTVATITATATYLYSLGWRGGEIGEAIWTIILIAISVIIGIYISWKYENIIYPLVVVWAIMAIWAARKIDYPSIALASLIASGALLIWCIFLGVKLSKKYFLFKKNNS